MSVGEKIKSYMSEICMSQTYLSQRTGIPLPKLNLALNGKRKVTLEEYELICGALEVGIDRFLKPKQMYDSWTR